MRIVTTSIKREGGEWRVITWVVENGVRKCLALHTKDSRAKAREFQLEQFYRYADASFYQGEHI